MNTNPYPYTGIIDVPREETSSLLAKVLAITAVGFFVTALGVVTSPAGGSFLAFIAVFALIFAIRYAQRANPALGLGLFYLLTYFMGWEIGPLIHMYIRTIGLPIVLNAVAITGLGMACMGIIAYLFSIDYRRIAGIGFAALLVLMLAGFVSIFFHFMTPDTYSWLTLGVFSLLVVGDFARIRQGGGGLSAVSLSLSIYLDAVNIFLAVLQLLSGRRRN